MSKNPSVGVVKIPPGMAQEWLGKNVNFRKINPSNVDQLADSIAKGHFELTQDAIAFNDKGELINGQHRLAACVKANKTITCLVIRGLDSDRNIDFGRRRLLGQVMRRDGVANANTVASAARIMCEYEADAITKTVHSGRFDNITIIETLQRHPGLEHSVGVARIVCRIRVSGAVFGFLHYIAAKADSAKADAFIDGLANGENLDRSSPVFLLRDALTSRRVKGQGVAQRTQLALGIKALNADFANARLRLLRWGGEEEMPTITFIKRDRGLTA